MCTRRAAGPPTLFGFTAAALLCLGLQIETTASKSWVEDEDVYDAPLDLQRDPPPEPPSRAASRGQHTGRGQSAPPGPSATPDTNASNSENPFTVYNTQTFSKVPLFEDPLEWSDVTATTSQELHTRIYTSTSTKKNHSKKKSRVLNAELLAALQEPLDQVLEYGDKIHEYLVKLWPPILIKGLSRALQEKLSQKYLVPSNCKLLQAPRLNVEISGMVPAAVRQLDRALMAQQQQLGHALTAVSRALHLLLTGGDKKKVIQHLSNGCRLISDLHSIFTQNRIKLIIPRLRENVLQIIQGSERDDTLFGKKVSLKLQVLEWKKGKKPSLFKDDQQHNPALFPIFGPEERDTTPPPPPPTTTSTTSRTTTTTTTTAHTTTSPMYDVGIVRLKSPFDYSYFINKNGNKNT